jgi:hypothetical protein
MAPAQKTMAFPSDWGITADRKTKTSDEVCLATSPAANGL